MYPIRGGFPRKKVDLMKLVKNRDTYNYSYKMYKAEYVKTLGIPLFNKNNFDEMINNKLYSKTRAKKENIRTGEIGGFYRMHNGYVPVFYAAAVEKIN